MARVRQLKHFVKARESSWLQLIKRQTLIAGLLHSTNSGILHESQTFDKQIHHPDLHTLTSSFGTEHGY